MHRTFVLALTLALAGGIPALAAHAQSAPPPASENPPKNAKNAPAAQEWAGLWYSSFGYVELEADGHEITGTYSCCGGEIEGTLEGSQLQFSWDDPIYGDGWGYWYWEDGGTRLRGIFGKMEDMGTGGQWNAVRLPEPTLEDPVRLTVRAEHPRHGTFRGEAVLSSLEGESIEGYLKGAYDLEARDKPFKYEMWNTLHGHREDDTLVLEWVDPLHETLGDLRVTRTEDGDWAGTWQPHFTEDEDERREVRLK